VERVKESERATAVAAGGAARPGGAPTIVARGLRKAFGDVVAVDGVDLEARAGTCLGLLGPNGAGKTTTIEILEGLTDADAGEVSILGLDWARGGAEIRRRMGVQLQETELPQKLSVFELLRVFRGMYPAGRGVEEVLALVGLEEKRKALVEQLSGGQKQRLSLGCALVHRPDVLFLDEPTTGLDPQARRRVWEVVEAFKRDGGTVLLTTHYMDEAERLADHLVIIDHGRRIAEGSPREIIAGLGTASIVEFDLCASDGDPVDGERARELASGLAGVTSCELVGGRPRLAATDVETVLPALFEAAGESGLVVRDLSTHRPTLEDVFVALTGRHLRDG